MPSFSLQLQQPLSKADTDTDTDHVVKSEVLRNFTEEDLGGVAENERTRERKRASLSSATVHEAHHHHSKAEVAGHS